MKIANIDTENLHIFWTTWGILTSRKDVTYDNNKSHKKQGFTLSLADTNLEKPQGAQIDPTPNLLRVNLTLTGQNFIILIFIELLTVENSLRTY